MSGNKDYKSATSIYDFTANSIKGEEIPLSKYRDHVCLIVNVASKCGLTATNYKELNELYDEYAESKGNLRDITKVTQKSYFQVKFDLFEKINVNGEKTHPLWAYLKQEKGGLLGSFIKWNFTKFIVDKEGKVVERHGPNVDPHKLKDSLEKYF
ncbi:putative phospholipid hydroperoxide glutathione peroxidase isoform x1 [Lasius niger]|uniref:Glutathione peroxidase n=1 Tax=Lasius niger TaxID=67767 RepID=A0A0J7KN25_LASNI|nr:putative phospholipid hydroperoxide glutathione peroxidase isoform x1 [Lasius niger]